MVPSGGSWLLDAISRLLLAGTAGLLVLVVTAPRRPRTPRPSADLVPDTGPTPTIAAAGAGAGPFASAAMSSQQGLPDEASMPRWRRPSVIAARSARAATERDVGTVRPRGTRPPRTFADGTAPGSRAVARYEDVYVLDRPNESSGAPQAILRAGDQVAILERDEVWVRVATVDGLTGWVLGLTLELEAGPFDPGQSDAGTTPAT